MSDTYFDLPSRLEDSFPEIDSDIVTDLRKNNEEYAEIQQQISELKKQFPCIMNVMEEKGEIHLTAEEHAAFFAAAGRQPTPVRTPGDSGDAMDTARQHFEQRAIVGMP